jgi:hypothetical protein
MGGIGGLEVCLSSEALLSKQELNSSVTSCDATEPRRGKGMIDLIGNIAIILQTGMDWMSNVMVKKVDVWTQLVPFCRLGHIKSQYCPTDTC